MKVHENCKGSECGSYSICSENTSMRYGCIHHESNIELCATCKYLGAIKGEVGMVCLLNLDETSLDDYCGHWEYEGD